ncbi:MAG TPA: hypothetical protein VHV55_08635 [Pirellulales bacterium]|jgi:hypothetical protein|nr:hypothetical protein [Pirellulales bacterium]
MTTILWSIERPNDHGARIGQHKFRRKHCVCSPAGCLRGQQRAISAATRYIARMNEKPRRRWLAFRLRMLLVLIAIAAVPLAWVGYSLEWIRERRLMAPRHSDKPPGSPNPDAAPIMPPGLLWVFGEQGFYALRWDPSSPGSLDDLRRAFPESKIFVCDSPDDWTVRRELSP